MLKWLRVLPLIKMISPIISTIGSTKRWWKSETIWLNIGAVVVAAGGIFGFDLAGIDVAGFIGPVFAGGMALLNIMQRFGTDSAIE